MMFVRNQPVELTEDLNKSDYPWLPRDLATGEVWYVYGSQTFGVVEVNNGVACTEVQGMKPFFELPKDALREVALDADQ